MESVWAETLSRRRAFLRLAALAYPAAGFAQKREGARIDAGWFRERLEQETERTLKTMVAPSGYLGTPAGRGGPLPAQPASPGSYRPTGLGPGSPTSQGRNLFVLALGYELTRKPEFLEAVAKATDFIRNHFHDKQYGGLFAAVDPNGKVLDDRKESYGTAHAILGLSSAARVSGRKKYADLALKIWSEMKAGLQDQYGLFKRETSRDFKTEGPGKKTQNPVMHLFEALLALHDATRSDTVYKDIARLADTVLSRLYREPGYIPELYDRDWKPIPAGPPGQTEPDGSPLDPYNAYAAAAQTGHIEIGHLIEWAFFLSRAVEKGFSRKYLSYGERLLNYALKVGYDHTSGGVFGYADYDGKPTAESSVRGWQIAELLKMLLHWAVLRQREDLWGLYEKSLAAVKSSGSLPGGYHGCGLYAEALRLAKIAG